jgi:hypothetical protein
MTMSALVAALPYRSMNSCECAKPSAMSRSVAPWSRRSDPVAETAQVGHAVEGGAVEAVGLGRDAVEVERHHLVGEADPLHALQGVACRR